MAAGSIVIDLLMRTGSFETDTKRAEQRVKEFQKSVKGITSDFGLSALSIGGAAAALAAWTKATVDGLDALNDFADATGTSVENASALEDVARRSGASLDSAASILVKFNNVLKEAKPGQGADEVLRQLGLHAERLKGLDPAEALRQTAVALSQFADDGSKARVVQELFGKSVREAAPFLKDLAEQSELVATVTKEDAEAAEDFNKALFSLEKSVVDISRTISGPFIKALADVASGFRTSQKESDSFFESYLKGVAKLATLPASLGMSFGRQVSGERSSAATDQPALPSLLRNRQQMGIGGGGGVDWDLIERNRDAAEEAARATKRQTDAAQAYLENLQRQLQATQDLTVADKVRTDIAASELGKLTQAQELQLITIAQQIDAARALESQLKAEREQERALADEKKANAEQGRRLYEETRTPLEKLDAEQDRLNKLLDEGAIKWDVYSRAILNSSAEYDEAMAKADAAGKQIDDFAKNAAENIQRSIGDGLVDAMNGNFKDIGDSFLHLINRLVAESIAADLARKLFGEGGSGGIGSTAISAIGSFFGFGGAKAGGGDVMPGHAYLVGEHGPESFVPRTMGTILPASAAASQGRREVNISVTVNAPPGMDRRTALQVGTDVGRQIQLAMARNS